MAPGVELADIDEAPRSELEMREGLSVGPERDLVPNTHREVRAVRFREPLPGTLWRHSPPG